jgi:hypothetical protein
MPAHAHAVDSQAELIVELAGHVGDAEAVDDNVPVRDGGRQSEPVVAGEQGDVKTASLGYFKTIWGPSKTLAQLCLQMVLVASTGC